MGNDDAFLWKKLWLYFMEIRVGDEKSFGGVLGIFKNICVIFKCLKWIVLAIT